MEESGTDSPAPKKGTWGLNMKKFVGVISKSILIVLCFMAYLVIIPIFLLLMTPMYLYRFFVKIAQKIFKPEWTGMVSPRDALVGLDNTSSRCECMITLLLTMKGDPDMKKVLEVFQNEVINGRNSKGELCYQKLLNYYDTWLGLYFWKKEENFLLENHVHELDPSEYDCIRENNNTETGVSEEQLMKILGARSTKCFPHGVAPWEALVIRNYKKAPGQLHHYKANVPIAPVERMGEKDCEFALVLRIHHAMGDGYSIMKLVMSNLCIGALDRVPKAPTRRISPLTLVLNYLAIFFLTPYYHFLQFILHIDKAMWHLPSKKLTKQWQFSMTERLSFDSIKETSKKHGVCVTATLVAGLSGGLHNFLREKGHHKKNNKIMRALSPMPWKGHPMETLVNHWTVGIFDIPAHESCPRKRLAIANESANRLKRSPIMVTNFMTVPVLLSVPKCMTDLYGKNWMTTMIISNFPGPDFACNALYDSHYIDDVISWVPHMRGSAGMGVMFQSYNGGVRVTISVDKAIIKDQTEVSELSNHISQEFLQLRSLQPTGAETNV
ncbi:hypothetical protein Ocin01_08412 [Orchesella cincta]|uniref:O-acyltransferase WSD1 C-terminal domain-containing protein n=1 Tax=Orchesella cincta TaxID=48709 RepID=A0A1D2MZM6_ORCCI|nr:hypothetical protein Ocin01_08412 [Orchesella cincta]